jgi:hypothetical protein
MFADLIEAKLRRTPVSVLHVNSQRQVVTGFETRQYSLHGSK